MPFGKKLSRIFNRTVTHGGFVAASLALSVGIGAGVSLHESHPRSASAPVANVQMHDAEVSKLQTMADEILAQQARIDFNTRSVEQAQANLGKGDAKLGDQLAAVAQANEQNLRDKQAQHARLAAYRKEILFNNTVSEKEAQHIYVTLFEKADAQKMGDITDFFSPFSDALKQRDEVTAKAGLAGSDPQKVTDATAASIVDAMRSATTAQGWADELSGLEDGVGTAGLLFGLSGIGAALRRREKRRQPDTAPETVPAAAPPPPPAPEPDVTPQPVAKIGKLSL